MLYTNAQLLGIYAEAWRLTRRPLYREVAKGIGDYLLRRMAAPEGGFFTAEDAEVGHEEGASYLWSTQEIEAVLGDEAARAFFEAYALTRLAVLREADAQQDADRGALRLRMPPRSSAIPPGLAAQRGKLLAARDARAQPARDEKMIVALNGLAIGRARRSGKILGEPAYLAAARRAAERIWALAYDTPARQLRHEAYRGIARATAFSTTTRSSETDAVARGSERRKDLARARGAARGRCAASVLPA